MRILGRSWLYSTCTTPHPRSRDIKCTSWRSHISAAMQHLDHLTLGAAHVRTCSLEVGRAGSPILGMRCGALPRSTRSRYSEACIIFMLTCGGILPGLTWRMRCSRCAEPMVGPVPVVPAPVAMRTAVERQRRPSICGLMKRRGSSSRCSSLRRSGGEREGRRSS